MPLIQSKDKKAFSKNVEKEMDAGKPRDQALAIAYSVKRKNARKKMAKGGKVNESAATEHRPMPEERDNDAKMVSQNSEKKALVDAQATSRPDIKQSTRGMRTTPIKHPQMVPSKGFSAKLRDQEDDLQSSASVNNGPQKQPPEMYNEEDADKKGPSVPALNMKMMAQGGEASSPHGVEVIGSPGGFGKIIIIKHKQEDKQQMAEGGVISAADEKRADIEDEYNDMAEISHNRAKDALPRGEDMHPMDDMDQFSLQPEEEEAEERHSSIAAAIMAKRKMMADGGILSHDSIYSDDSSQVDLKRNAQEDANEEDQLSFNALRKENYSESEGLRKLNQPMNSNLHGDDIDSDDHDMVSSIRRKMAMKRASK